MSLGYSGTFTAEKDREFFCDTCGARCTRSINGDPNASLGFVAVLSVAAVLFTAFAVWVYRPLFGADEDPRGEY